MKSCVYETDKGIIQAVLDSGDTLALNLYEIESELDAGMAAGSRLTWLAYNEPQTYAELYLAGELQEYCDLQDRVYAEQAGTIQRQLEKHFGDEYKAAAITREIMMYD